MRLLFIFLFSFSCLYAEILQQFEGGSLEKTEGQLVLHVKGTAYERGLQHGKLLKQLIQQNISTFLEGDRPQEQKDRALEFKRALPTLLKHIPQNILEEMKGVAEGSEIPYEKILALNLFPEMFHCSAITAHHQATKNGDLYHVRVLDYAIGKGLQNTAVIMCVEPKEGYAFLNVSYAGFIGSVTGMNAQKIAVGEIGGKGYGSWNGVPMAFLMRMILEKASSLEEAREILKNTPRTCEYFYIVSDGKDNASFGAYATADKIQFLEAGTQNTFLISYKDGSKKESLQKQPKDCLVLTGLSDPERFPVLVERLEKSLGNIDEKVLMQVIQGPAGKTSNLHTAIFLPSKLEVWVAHAGPNGEPAYTQPYVKFSVRH
jgi:isopenicillin-N N-acyltransferase-like protein